MTQYDEQTARREHIPDRAEYRRRYNELLDSGKVKGALTVMIAEPEPGDDPGTVRMMLLTDGVSMAEASAMVRHAVGALSTIRRNDAEEETKAPPSERVIEAQGRLAEQWLRYADAMDMDKAPAPLYAMFRKSFYAGIATLYAELCEAGEPAEEAPALVEALHAELRAFCIDEMLDEEPVSHARH